METSSRRFLGSAGGCVGLPWICDCSLRSWPLCNLFSGGGGYFFPLEPKKQRSRKKITPDLRLMWLMKTVFIRWINKKNPFSVNKRITADHGNWIKQHCSIRLIVNLTILFAVAYIQLTCDRSQFQCNKIKLIPFVFDLSLFRRDLFESKDDAR